MRSCPCAFALVLGITAANVKRFSKYCFTVGVVNKIPVTLLRYASCEWFLVLLSNSSWRRQCIRQNSSCFVRPAYVDRPYFCGCRVDAHCAYPAAGRLIEAFSSYRQTPVGRNNWNYVAFPTGVFRCFLLPSRAAPFIRYVSLQKYWQNWLLNWLLDKQNCTASGSSAPTTPLSGALPRTRTIPGAVPLPSPRLPGELCFSKAWIRRRRMIEVESQL